MSQKNSVFSLLDLDVLRQESGVYLLQHKESTAVRVGLLYRAQTAAPQHLQLFMYEVPPTVPVQEVFEHWKTLDARRLEESGLAPVEVSLGFIPAERDVRFLRPDGERIRVAVELSTGDVVCMN